MLRVLGAVRGGGEDYVPCLPRTPGLVKVPVYLIIATFLAQSTGSCMRWRGIQCVVSAVYPWTSQSSCIFDNSNISYSEYGTY